MSSLWLECIIWYLSTGLAHKLRYLSFLLGKEYKYLFLKEYILIKACENCLLIIELGKLVISGLVWKIFHI